VGKIYAFELWDDNKREAIAQPFKTPASYILRVRGKIISVTAEEMDASCLDSNGQLDLRRSVPYRPV
jgi:hypothetical protein